MDVPRVLVGGVVFGESPRWHAGRLWFGADRSRCSAGNPPGRCSPSRSPRHMPATPDELWAERARHVRSARTPPSHPDPQRERPST
jgi:hypothetical protein